MASRNRKFTARHSTEVTDSLVTDASSRRPVIFATLIALVTFLAFWPALSNQFVNWDDDVMFTDNPHYRGLGWSQLSWMFTTFHVGHYQPLSWLTLGLDYLIWGMDPFGYHLTNLVLHGANAVLFFCFCRLLLARVWPAAVSGAAWRLDCAAALAAIVFALHPLRVESVAWATERRDVLSGVFFLTALYVYLRAHGEAASDRARWRWLSFAVVAHLLSLSAKATAMTLPLVLIILDLYPLRRLGGWRDANGRLVLAEKLPFFLLSLLAGIVALMAQHASGALRPVQQYFLSYRIGQGVYGMIFYPWKTLLPVGLSPLYELPYDFEAWTALFVLCAAMALAITVLAILVGRRWQWFAACWAYYVIVVAPVLGVAQSGVQLVADRYSYLSCLSWAALAGGMGFYCLQKRQAIGVRVAAMALVVIVFGFGLLTRAQVLVWRDSETLWKHALRVTPESAIANYNLGKVYESNDSWPNSVELYRRAVAINPTYAEAHYNLARLLGRQGQVDEAISHYHEALKFKPNDAETHNNLGQLWVMKGNVDAALEAYQKALALDPRFAKAYFNLGRLWVRQGDIPAAIENLRSALALSPDVAEIHAALGEAFVLADNRQQAMLHYSRAVELKPQWDEAQAALSRLTAGQPKP